MFQPDEQKLNVYNVIHKYARFEIGRLVVLAGSTNFLKEPARQHFIDEFKKLVHFLDDHATREETHIHPLLQECKSNNLAPVEIDHAKLDGMTKGLLTRADQIKTVHDGYQFYLDFSVFQARYLIHLNDEETQLLTDLHNYFPNERLLQMNGELMSTMPKEYMVSVTRGMLPVINHQERVDIFSAMRQSPMPPEAFLSFCQMALEVLPNDESTALFTELDIQ